MQKPPPLATTSPKKTLMPVTLPPGCARLVTRPILMGSAVPNTIGIVVVAALAARVYLCGSGGNHGHATTDQISQQRGYEAAFRENEIDDTVLPSLTADALPLAAVSDPRPISTESHSKTTRFG
jgi:hypothetical protein